MKVVASALAFLLMATSVMAQSAPKKIVREGPAGKKTITLDGTYCSCFRGSRSLGYSPDDAKDFCDKRPNLVGTRSCK